MKIFFMKCERPSLDLNVTERDTHLSNKKKINNGILFLNIKSLHKSIMCVIILLNLHLFLLQNKTGTLHKCWMKILCPVFKRRLDFSKRDQ